MTEQQLHSFILIADQGSFTKAESAVFLSKQALKKQIDALEKELGFSLFNRNYQGIALTPAGSEFYIGAKQILKQLGGLKHRCSEIAHHQEALRIVIPNHPKPFIEGALIEYAKRFPNVKQYIVAQSSDDLVHDILMHHTDLAECICTEALYHPNLICTPLSPMPYYCLLSPNHPLVKHRLISLEALSEQSLGFHRQDEALFHQITTAIAKASIVVNPQPSMQWLYNLCNNGGIFISCTPFVQALEPLIAIPLETELLPVSAVIYHAQASPLVRDFAELVKTLYT